MLVVTKFRYIGDTVVAAPLLAGARRAFPEARITVLTGPAATTVLQNHPDVDRVVTYDPYTKDRGTLALLRAARTVRHGGRPDLCLVADRSYRAALAAFFSGGRVRAGFSTEGRSWLLTHPVPYRGDKHEIDCDLDILRTVAPEPDGQPYDRMPRLSVTPQEREKARDFLTDRGVAPEALLIGMQAAAGDPSVRQWPSDRFAAVADRLAVETGACLVLLGNRDERPVAERVASGMTMGQPILVAGETDLRQAMAVISLCRLWIGNDGGMLHVAAALGVPTVGIFGPTKAPRWGYTTPPHCTLAVHPSTPVTDDDRETVRRCLDAVTADAVFDAAHSILHTLNHP